MMSAKKITFLGFSLAVSLVLSYIESLIPFFFGVPGMKLGLANAAVCSLLYLTSWKKAAAVNLLRILLSGLLFGNVFSIVYSLGGAVCSLLIMVLLKRVPKLSPILVSVCGGMMHNVGQILVAIFVMHSVYLVYYLPFLLTSGAVTGALIGGISVAVIMRIRRSVNVRIHFRDSGGSDRELHNS